MVECTLVGPLDCIVPIFQFTSGLCLTNQPYSRNISVPFKSVTTASICPLIFSSSSTNHIM